MTEGISKDSQNSHCFRLCLKSCPCRCWPMLNSLINVFLGPRSQGWTTRPWKSLSPEGLRERMKSSFTWIQLRNGKCHFSFERTYLRWLIRKPPGRLSLEVLQTHPAGWSHQGKPRTYGRDNAALLAWEQLHSSQNDRGSGKEKDGWMDGCGWLDGLQFVNAPRH